jgi:hypothetical protein
MLGRDNLFVLKLTQQDQITGDTNENDILGAHAVLHVKARLIAVKMSLAAAQADGSNVIKLYAGSGKDGTAVLSSGVTLTPSTLKANGTIADIGKIYDPDQEFALSETSAAKTFDGLGVDLYFRAYGVDNA